MSLTYRPELADAIVELLVDPTHDERSCRHRHLPRRLPLTQLAAVATGVTGDPYRYEPLDREEWIAYRRTVGRPAWSIVAGITYYDGSRAR